MTNELFPVERYGPVGAAMQNLTVGDYVPPESVQVEIRSKVAELLTHCELHRLEEQYQGEDGLNRYIDEVLMHWIYDAWTAAMWMIIRNSEERFS